MKCDGKFLRKIGKLYFSQSRSVTEIICTHFSTVGAGVHFHESFHNVWGHSRSAQPAAHLFVRKKIPFQIWLSDGCAEGSRHFVASCFVTRHITNLSTLERTHDFLRDSSRNVHGGNPGGFVFASV